MINTMEEYRKHLINLERSKKTIYGYMSELDFFRKYLEEELNGPFAVTDITSDDINDFLLYLKEERNYKPASRRRLAATLKGFCKWAYKQDIIKVDLADRIPSIKVPESERKFLSAEEVEKWINEVPHEVSKVAMWIMYYAGLRISEATGLKMDDVRLEDNGGWLMIRNAKGGKFRRVPIAPLLAEILNDYMTWKAESDYLLATERTGGIHTVTIQAELRYARKRLGWPEDITPHTLRHSFASHIYEKTQDILVVSKLLGHSNLSTTQIYAHLHDDKMVDAVNVF